MAMQNQHCQAERKKRFSELEGKCVFEAYSSLELPGSQVVVLLSSLMVRLDVRIELGFVEMTTWFISKGELVLRRSVWVPKNQ